MAADAKLSPQEIKNKEFKKAMWGYSPQEVVEFLEQTAKQWDRHLRQEKELQDKLKTLSEELTRWKNKELEIQKLREKAVHEAEAMRAEATKEAQRIFGEVEERANDIRSKTEEWLERVIAEVEETERQKLSFMTAFKSALDSHYALLKNDEESGISLSAKLNHFLRDTMTVEQQH